MTNNKLGATPLEWSHFAQKLNLSAHLLPCVPNAPDVMVLPGSALEGKVGKIPSVYNAQGQAHGLTQWTTREVTAADLAEWSKDDRYNICVRTGVGSGIYAFDVDIPDQTISHALADALTNAWPATEPLEWRIRAHTGKFLVPFRMAATWKKRVIETPHGRIELLGQGQQFVAAGTHASGTRYEWAGELPTEFPLLTEAQAAHVWSVLSTIVPDSKTNPVASRDQDDVDHDVMTSCDDETWTQLRQALDTLIPTAGDNDRWSEIGYALLSLKTTRPARDLWCTFSQQAPNYIPNAPEIWWDTHEGQVPRSDYRHIFSLARDAGWRSHLDPGAFTAPSELAIPSSDAIAVEAISGDRVRSQDDAGLPEPVQPSKPIFRIEGGNNSFLMDKAQQVLAPHVFVRAGRLVELRTIDDTLRAVVVSSAWIGDKLSRLGHWERFDIRRQAWVSCDCPDKFAVNFNNLGAWGDLPMLDAIATAPFIREDGSICEQPGYDERSRTMYRPSDTFAAIPENPTRDDAVTALKRLMHPFDQFPFVSDSARAAFIAHIFTEAARLSVDRVPMFWYSAQGYGVGKSLLAELPALLVHGVSPTPRSWPTTGDELRKAVFAYLLQDERSIFFDNVPRGYKSRSPELSAIITSDRWSDRKLGVSEGLAVRNRATIVASGNNPTPTADMARRSIVVRIVSYEKNRTFKIPDIRKYIKEHRPELVVDVLTILRAFTRAQETPTLAPLASFERWSRLVRNAVVWLGLPDPVSTQETETDDETLNPTRVFTVLGAVMNGRPFNSSDVCILAASNEQLNQALLDGGCDEPYSARKVGFWLRDYRDCVAEGWKLMQCPGTTHGYYRWALVPTTEEASLL